jgi:hypothetical protein
LPIQSTSVYGAAPSGLQNTAGLISGLGGLFGDLSKIPGVSSGLGSLFSGVGNWWDQMGATNTYNQMMDAGGFGSGELFGNVDLGTYL